MYWQIKLISGALVLTSDREFQKMKATEYLSAEKIEFKDAIVRMFELQKQSVRVVDIPEHGTNEC